MLFNIKLRKARITSRIMGTESDYIRLWEKGRLDLRSVDCEIDETLDLGYIEKLALLTQTSIKKSMPNWNHGLYIYSAIVRLAKEFKLDHINFLDIGTGKGFSSLIMAKAANDLSISYHVSSIDILPSKSSIFWNSISDVKLGKLPRRQLLKDYAKELRFIDFFEMRSLEFFKIISPGDYNFIFIDGDHRFTNVYNELNTCIRLLDRNGLIFLDDYDEMNFPGVVKAVRKFIKENPHFNLRILGKAERKYVVLSRT